MSEYDNPDKYEVFDLDGINIYFDKNPSPITEGELEQIAEKEERYAEQARLATTITPDIRNLTFDI